MPKAPNNLNTYEAKRQRNKERSYASNLRDNSTRWRKLSLSIRTRFPICVQEGCGKASKEVHHIVPIEENPSLMYVNSNLVPLCRKCHKKIEYEIDRLNAKDYFDEIKKLGWL